MRRPGRGPRVEPERLGERERRRGRRRRGGPHGEPRPDGALPEISFSDDGIPTMEAIPDAAPTDITVKTLAEGDGETVAAGAYVTVNYAGFLWTDGTQFDSSFDRGEPTSFSLNQVVDGWKYGLIDTKIGDRVQIIVPAEYGYGDQESETIPANSVLVFVVDIVSTTNLSSDILAEASATGAELPAGLTVSGEIGAEPEMVFEEGSSAPAEAQVVVLSEGTGAAITENDTVFYLAAGAEWGGETSTTWPDEFQQVSGGGGEETIGRKIGSRILLVYPASEENGTAAQALIIDLVGAVPQPDSEGPDRPRPSPGRGRFSLWVPPGHHTAGPAGYVTWQSVPTTAPALSRASVFRPGPIRCTTGTPARSDGRR
ncbi:FKBP-type peptidyl-prolyl cis-trans isomerase [Tessaracoccus coleopterorum]|uniref:FKBP-type peptidyl-prolyl cis-trans isomerase n=1 Tax=Tessaracoccus coleopterorum TaxID=2714950 RepID=UPI0018D30F09|nr:FKBP-type peptidyl-prolyl cis-trans isomerase [Tessaracoccus coleopterorum]